MFVGVQTNKHLFRMSSPGKSPPAAPRQSEAGDSDSPLVFLLIGTAWCIKQIARAVSLAARSTWPYLSALRLLARPAPSSADLQDFTRVALHQDNALARAVPPQPMPPPVAAHSLPLHALSGTRKLLHEIKEHHHTDAQDITERLARSRPSPWSPLRWLLGGQLIVEGLRRPPVFSSTGLWSPGVNLTGFASAFEHGPPGSVRPRTSWAAPRCIPGAKPRRSRGHVPGW